MTDGETDDQSNTTEELREKLRRTRARVRTLETELAETNEGMVALTLELENAKERYQTIFEESTDGILLIDTERDEIHEANPRACDILGYDRDELVTLSPETIFPAKSDRSHSFAEAVVDGWADDFTCRKKDGKRIDVDISASVVSIDGRSLLLASLRDITERKRREQRIQVLSRIFRHNLRNDGNVIQGHADLLCDGLSDSTYEESAVQIQQTIDEMLQLSSKVRRLQDLLDQNQVAWRPIDALLSEQRERVAQTFPETSITVTVPDQEISVDRRLGGAIQETLENAAKHAQGESTIQIAVDIDESRGHVRVTIEDDGPGIPQQELEALRSGGETQLAHGSGIGLWCIHWVVDSLGGTVSIRADQRSGTVVSISVPRRATDSDGQT